MPFFCVQSVKIYTGQRNLHEYIRGVRDKYQVWSSPSSCLAVVFKAGMQAGGGRVDQV